MSTVLNFPKSGMGIDEGTVIRWLKREGDPVALGEIVVEIETAKATQDVEAPVAGVLTKILVAEGETVPVNTDLGLIE